MGDPSLSHAKLGEFSAKLQQRGIKVIRGDVILDKSYFASTAGMSEQFHGEVDNPIHLPPQPLLVSGKFVTVSVSPDKNGGGVRVSVQPSLPGVTVVNGVTAAPGPCTRPKDGVSVNVTGNARQATINLGGTLAEACGVFSKKVSVLSADGYFAASFKRSFEQLGGRIDGQIHDGTTASRSKLFGAIESDALIDIIRETNKSSNNLMARQIFLTIGSELTGEPPSPSRAAIAVRKWIAERVPDTAPFVLENGSGLSDNERVTAKGMVSLLDYIRKSQHAAAFLETMPAVGEDGTMRNRLKDDAVAGKSVAKTGTLRDTAAIAGLVLTKRGRTFIFCMIVNHSNITAGRKVIDRLIAWLHSPDVDA